MRSGAAASTTVDLVAVDAPLRALCADGQHVGALVDLVEPPPPPPRLVGEVVVGPSPPPVLPYTVTSSRCSVCATVRLRSLALRLVPLAVPSARPLWVGAGGTPPACHRRLLPIAPATTSPTAASSSGGDTRMAVSSDDSGGDKGSGSGGSGSGGGNGFGGDRGGGRRQRPQRVTERPSLPHPATAVAIPPAVDAVGLAAAVAAAAEAAIEAAPAREAASARKLAAATTLSSAQVWQKLGHLSPLVRDLGAPPPVAAAQGHRDGAVVVALSQRRCDGGDAGAGGGRVTDLLAGLRSGVGAGRAGCMAGTRVRAAGEGGNAGW